jgi:hypothetical protein
MADYRIKLTDTINFNVDFNNTGADVGITYTLPGDFANKATLTSAGLLTPSEPGMLVVEARNADGNLLHRFTVEVLAAEAAAFEQSVGTGANTLNTSIASPQNPVANQPAEIVGVPQNVSVMVPQQPHSLNIDTGSNTFSWGSVSGVTRYEYQLSTSATPSAAWTTVFNTTSVNFSAETYGGSTLYAFVRSRNAGGASSTASTSAAIPVPVPAVAAPTGFTGYQNRAYGSGPDIDWSWTSVQGYTYEYYIGALNAPTPASGTPTSGYYVTGMGSVARGTTAKAWLRAKNSDNQYSAWVTATQTVPVMDTPVFQGEGLSAAGSVSWWGVTGASNYDYQITTSATPGPSWSNTPNNWIHNINMSQYAGQTVYVFVRAGSTANNPTSAENNPYATSSRAVPA